MDDWMSELVALARRKHRDCEDCWYSCPKSEGGCCDDRQGGECNCGADEINARVDEIIMAMARQRSEE